MNDSINNTVLTGKELDHHLLKIAKIVTNHVGDIFGLDEKPAIEELNKMLNNNNLKLIKCGNG